MYSPYWEADSSSASQKIPIACSPKFHYRIQNSPPLVPILSQIKTVHLLPNDFLKMRSNIILPSTTSLPSGLFPPDFPTKNL
jgi:hypothetical protein